MRTFSVSTAQRLGSKGKERDIPGAESTTFAQWRLERPAREAGGAFSCLSPRRHYDILEDRVPSGLVGDYRSLLSQCEESYRKFSNLRSSLSSCHADTEQENLSMVEGLKLYSEIEQLKQKLKLIENPLLRSARLCPGPARPRPPPVGGPSDRPVGFFQVRVWLSEEFQHPSKGRPSQWPEGHPRGLPRHDDRSAAVSAQGQALSGAL